MRSLGDGNEKRVGRFGGRLVMRYRDYNIDNVTSVLQRVRKCQVVSRFRNPNSYLIPGMHQQSLFISSRLIKRKRVVRWETQRWER